jgi:hypothetical protein
VFREANRHAGSGISVGEDGSVRGGVSGKDAQIWGVLTHIHRGHPGTRRVGAKEGKAHLISVFSNETPGRRCAALRPRPRPVTPRWGSSSPRPMIFCRWCAQPPRQLSCNGRSTPRLDGSPQSETRPWCKNQILAPARGIDIAPDFWRKNEVQNPPFDRGDLPIFASAKAAGDRSASYIKARRRDPKLHEEPGSYRAGAPQAPAAVCTQDGWHTVNP